MTLPGLFGAWVRRLRSPASRPDPSRLGGNRSGPRRGRDRSGRPGSPGRASAAARGIAGALDGLGRSSRAAVPALVCLALLAGVAPQASAQTLPTVSFSASGSVDESAGRSAVWVLVDSPLTTDLTVKYTVGGTATAGSDFTIANSGTVTVPRGSPSGAFG